MPAATENGAISGGEGGLRVSRHDQAQVSALEILLPAQDREVEVRHFDPRDLVAGDRSTFCMGIGECVAETLAAWIGMALDNRYPARHGPGFLIARVF